MVPGVLRSGRCGTEDDSHLTHDLQELVDDRTGLIRSISRLGKSREEPELPIIYQARLCNFDFRKADLSARMASGKGMSDRASADGAIAEALERYCASQPDATRLRYAAAAELPLRAIPPEAFVLYSERQYAERRQFYRRPNGAAALTWIEARCVGDESPVFVPASLVYLNFTGDSGAELFAPATSNGLAAGPDLSQATLAGLYELIERDAFIIAWMNRLPVPRIDFGSANGIADSIARHYRQFGIELIAFALTSDLGVPVMMALALDRSGAVPAIVVGLGCNLSPAIALERAVMEVSQVRAGAAARYRQEERRYPTQYPDIRTLEDHAAFAALPANLPEFSFLLDGTSVCRLTDYEDQSTGDLRSDLAACEARLAASGSLACYVDLTLPDIEPYPVRVVRAMATGLQPIHFGYGEERLGGRRLFQVPLRLGHRDSEVTENDLNPCPHPLA
jgi:ribosomal protein S12 methylthiotransferase accessory factor